MGRDDPFTGIHLSEQTGAGKLDQRLFTSEPSPAPTKPKLPTKTDQPKPEEKPTTVETEPKKAPMPKVPVAPPARFYLEEQPLYKASFLFTEEELEKLEDLKLELRREYDVKVTKNNLIRAGLHMLLEDHAANGSRSYASRKTRKL